MAALRSFAVVAGALLLCASCAEAPRAVLDGAVRGEAVRGESEARTFVALHNAVRAAVQRPRGYAGSWVPLPPVAWSPALARSAQSWADQLRDSHECGLVHSTARVGENLAAGTGLVDARVAVGLWSQEGARYAWSPAYVFRRDTGHYTQLVWRNTTAIGCGEAQCVGRSVVVCQYSPAGNVIGRAPF